MKHILRESFDFNSVILSDNDIDNTVFNILINSISIDVIKNIVNKIAPQYYDTSIKIINNNEVDIRIDYSLGYFGIIKLIYNSNSIFDIQLKGFGHAYDSLLSECTKQILNYLKRKGINISSIIQYDTIYNSENKWFYLINDDANQVLAAIKNNYKIKLVDINYSETLGEINDKINELIIEIPRREKGGNIEIFKNNITNIDETTKITLY